MGRPRLAIDSEVARLFEVFDCLSHVLTKTWKRIMTNSAIPIPSIFFSFDVDL